MRVRYTQEAIHDLKRFRDFIEAKNPIAAAKVAGNLLSAIEKLKSFPLMGLKVENASLPEKIRDLFVGLYTIRYFFNGCEIIVLRLWHGKEKIPEP